MNCSGEMTAVNRSANIKIVDRKDGDVLGNFKPVQ